MSPDGSPDFSDTVERQYDKMTRGDTIEFGRDESDTSLAGGDTFTDATFYTNYSGETQYLIEYYIGAWGGPTLAPEEVYSRFAVEEPNGDTKYIFATNGFDVVQTSTPIPIADEASIDLYVSNLSGNTNATDLRFGINVAKDI